eukprot:3130713-Rhodomonas_salina.1
MATGDPEVLQYARAAFAVYQDDWQAAPEEEGGRPLDVLRFERFEDSEWMLVAMLFEVKRQASLGAGASPTYLLLSFRGTVPTCLKNIQADLQCAQEPLALDIRGKEGALVHSGFQDMYMASRDALRRKVANFASKCQDYSGSGFCLAVTGHSLGGALATLCALDWAAGVAEPRPTSVVIATFGKPHVGNGRFVELVLSSVTKILRVTNGDDPVPLLLEPSGSLTKYVAVTRGFSHEVPGEVLDIEKVLGQLHDLGGGGLMNHIQNAHQHIGAHATTRYWQALSQIGSQSNGLSNLRCVIFTSQDKIDSARIAYIAESIHRVQTQVKALTAITQEVRDDQLRQPAEDLKSLVHGWMQLLEDYRVRGLSSDALKKVSEDISSKHRLAASQSLVRDKLDGLLKQLEGPEEERHEEVMKIASYLAYVLHLSIMFELQVCDDDHRQKIAQLRLNSYGEVCGRFALEATLRNGK